MSAQLTEAALKKMKVPELKNELKLRTLKVSGKKEELIQRLLQAQSEGVVPSAEEEPLNTSQTKRKAADDLLSEKADNKKKKPEPKKQEISEEESEEEDDAEGSKDDYKDEGGDDDVDDEEDDDEEASDDIKSLTASGWGSALEDEFKKDYVRELLKYVAKERKVGPVYPPKGLVFHAFNMTPIEEVKVVIIGQDPYFNEGQAHGLCFSVMRGVAVPPSLKRIYKALEASIPGFKAPKHGCLEEWAARGVLMLNATLTVRKGKPNSHEKCGWQQFTDNVIKILCRQRKGLIFFLWGGFAKKKGAKINSNEHSVLIYNHPSPMGGRGPWVCDHFVRANQILKEQGKEPIDWTLSP